MAWRGPRGLCGRAVGDRPRRRGWTTCAHRLSRTGSGRCWPAGRHAQVTADLRAGGGARSAAGAAVGVVDGCAVPERSAGRCAGRLPPGSAPSQRRTRHRPQGPISPRWSSRFSTTRPSSRYQPGARTAAATDSARMSRRRRWSRRTPSSCSAATASWRHFARWWPVCGAADRAVVISGPAGVGKTRLAEVALGARCRFGDEIGVGALRRRRRRSSAVAVAPGGVGPRPRQARPCGMRFAAAHPRRRRSVAVRGPRCTRQQSTPSSTRPAMRRSRWSSTTPNGLARRHTTSCSC